MVMSVSFFVVLSGKDISGGTLFSTTIASMSLTRSAFTVMKDGIILVYEMEEEPACYCLMEMMIDKRCQNYGYGQRALRKLIEACP